MLCYNRRVKTTAIGCVLFTSANFLALSTPLMAQTSSVNWEHDEHNRGSRVSPAERIRRDDRKPRTRHDVDRPLDGIGNNLRDRDMNAADTPLRRLLANDYADQPRRTPRELAILFFTRPVAAKTRPVHPTLSGSGVSSWITTST
jgi:hypothetical protein